jgi:flagellar M-ring protein FliF
VKPLLDGLIALGPARLAAMGAVALVTFGLLAVLALRSGGEPMALLYGELDQREAAQIVDLLTRQRIAYRLGSNSSEVLVPASQVAAARLMLAKDGLPSGGSVGYEIFDRGDGLATSQFQQEINRTRALEGEIARTIRAIAGVRAARVHLALPRREPFSRDRSDPQASVMLTLAGAGRLDREGVQAILNLVAAAVPGLRPQGVTVVDSRGNLLARAGEPVGAGAGAGSSAEETRRAAELRLSRAVEEMLERSLGPGHVRAEAAVEMDFDHVQETQERFDPDGQVVRSTQTVSDTNKSNEAAASVSVSNNLPNAEPGATGAGTQEARQEETTNYEIGKTVRTTVREQPRIRRVSLAVMIDGAEEAGADGKANWRPRPPEEIARITSLARSAIGFEEKRGDHVEVVSMRFASLADGAGTPDRGRFGQMLAAIGLEPADAVRLGQTALIAVALLAGMLLVLRPMAMRLGGATPVAALGAAADPGDADAPAGAPAMAVPGAAPALAGPAASLTLEDDSLVDVAQVDGQMRASSLRRTAELVERYPEQTVTIMRGWMAQENA